MKLFTLIAATAVFTAFAPMSSNAQVSVEVPGVGFRIGEPPHHRDRLIERDVRGGSECKTVTVHETAPDGSSRTVTRKKCD
jgi:hypothetical protein